MTLIVLMGVGGGAGGVHSSGPLLVQWDTNRIPISTIHNRVPTDHKLQLNRHDSDTQQTQINDRIVGMYNTCISMTPNKQIRGAKQTTLAITHTVDDQLTPVIVLALGLLSLQVQLYVYCGRNRSIAGCTRTTTERYQQLIVRT